LYPPRGYLAIPIQPKVALPADGIRCGKSELVVGVAHVPFKGDALTLCVTNDAGHVAAKLRIVAWQEDQAGENAGPEFLEQGAIAIVAIDLPVRRDGPKEHDARVGYRWLVNGDI
jgi:hypothetical protein